MMILGLPNPLIVALDLSDLDRADALAALLAPEVAMLKVGFELFWAHGPEAVRHIGSHAPVFVDSKLHDIPNTVEGAAANITRLGVAMFNVHALGGEAMMRAALRGAERASEERGAALPLVIAVHGLESQPAKDLASPARSPTKPGGRTRRRGGLGRRRRGCALGVRRRRSRWSSLAFVRRGQR